MRNQAKSDGAISGHPAAQNEWLPDVANALHALEKRYVFDAALASDLLNAADAACTDGGCPVSEGSLGEALSSAATALDAPQTSMTAPTAVYVIDGNIDQRETIIAGLPAGAVVVSIDPARDGVTQLAAALEGMSGVSELHIFAHGDSGSISLGASVLNHASMDSLYRATLAGLGTHLSADADILVYGCNFAEGAEGQAAADLLSSLTGADVAASNDLTGAARLGGDWDLEYTAGSVESDSLAFADYDATLAPPVAVSETYTTDFNTAVSGDVSPNDSDPESDPLTFSVYAQPAHGSVSLNADGTFTYTPNTGFSGEDFFIYRVTDNTSSNPNFANASVTIVVSPGPNNPPVANDDSYSGNVNTQISGDVCTNDTDADNDTLSHSLTSGPSHGTLTLNTDGTFTYTPDNGYTGTDSFVYTSSDGNGGTDTATVTLTINGPVNNPPVANDDSYSGNVNTQISGDVCTNDTDADNDLLSHSLTSGPSHGTLTLNTDGTFTYTPDNGYTGTDSFVYTSNDGNGGTDTATVTLTINGPVNNPPVANDDSYSGNVNTQISGDVCTNDTDADNDLLSHSLTSGPSHGTLTLNTDGTFTYTPDNGYTGTDSFVYTSSDGNGGTDTATVTLTINGPSNSPPVANNDSYSTTQNTPVSGDVCTNDTDANGDTLSHSLTSGPSHGTLTLNTDGTFTYTPDNGYTGTDSFVYTSNDGNGGTDTATVTINVAGPTNSPPVANDDSYSGNVNTQISGDVCTNDTDANGDTLSHSLTSGPSHGTLTLNTDGTFTYTPDNGYTGTDSFVYTSSDGNGGTDTATVTLTINGPSNSPPVANNDSYSTTQNTPISGDVCTNDTDANGDTLSHSLTSGPSHGTLTLNTDGTFTYTPDNGYTGTDSFVYTSNDGNGGTDTATVTLTINGPSNNPPDAVNDTATTAVNQAVSGTVATNDSDPDGDTLTYAVQITPSHGSVSLNANGTFTYTPANGYAGTDSFSYTVNDGRGGTDSAVVTVTVIAVNAAPVFTTPVGPQSDVDGEVISLNLGTLVTDADSPQLVYAATGLPPGLSLNPLTGVVSGTIDRMASEVGPTGNGIYPVEVTVVDLAGGITTQTFTWTVTNPGPDAVDDAIVTDAGVTATGSVATNDADPDGDAVTFALGTGPSHGTLTLNANGSYTYVPNGGFNGADSFTYTMTDSQGASDTATVTITVNPVNGPPVVTGTVPDQTGTDNTAATLDISDCFADPNNDPLVFTATGLPAGLTIDPATGIISGTVAQNACAGGPLGNGVYSVTVTATDPSGLSVTHTFAWTITNPAPDAVNDTFNGLSGQPVTGTLTTNDSDPDGDALTYTLVSGPTAGSVVLNTNGTFTYSGNPLYSGADSFVYRLTDANGASDTATVSLTLAPTEVLPPTLSCIITFGDLRYLRSILGA